MRDDTGEDMPAFELGDLEKAKGLWKFSLKRKKAQTWAYRDIKFLVYDDTEDEMTETRKGCEGPARATNSMSDGLNTLQPQPGPSTLPWNPSAADEDAILQQAILESLESNDSFTNQPPTTDARPSVESQDAAGADDFDDADLQEAIRMSLMSDDDSIDMPPQAPTENSIPETTTGSTNTENAGDSECNVCSGLPAFPHNKKTRKFRLFRPSDEFPHLITERPKSVDICVHYVAVSYCWPEPVKNEQGEIIRPKVDSQVRDLDGVQRPARALDDILDRAVDFANTFGLRMIWIDQECLPQPDDKSSEEDKRYQQLGVQAMDIVYNRAMVTAGLHSSTITSQAQIDAIKALVAYGKDERHALHLNQNLFENVLDFLHMVQLDRWYTRAWVVQEAVSAGLSLILVFRRAPGVVYASAFREDSDRHMTPRHPLDSEKRDLPSEIICIPVVDFRDLVRAAKLLLERRFRATGQALVRTRPAFPILSVAESLHPRITERQHFSGIHMYAGRTYGGRQKLNAASSLTLLRSRHCRDVQDRLTILANMCSYEIRLDTEKVAQNCDSLRQGFLAIALLNGDTSILVPEMYEFPGDEDGHPDPLTDRRSGKLLSPFDTNLGRISNYAVQDGKLVNPRVYRHANRDRKSKGLDISAYIWTIDDRLDLNPLKYHYAETWHSMKCLVLLIEPRKEESKEDFIARKGLISQHFSRGYVMDQAKWEIFHHGSIAPDSTVWNGMDSAGIQVKARLDADRVEAVPEMQRIVAEIFFAILRYLNNLSTPQSIGVANSIWQSIRVDIVDKPRPKENKDLPDFVGEELFNHPDVLQTPFKTLQLDKSRGGVYHQTWIIDRIMQHGELWVGKYNRADTISSGSDGNKSRPADESQHPKKGTGPEKEFESKLPDTIIQRQLARRLLATLLTSGLEGTSDDISEDHAAEFNNSGLAWYGEVLKRGLFAPEAEETRVRQLTSTFNVDGPCVVATPFNPDWEVLPHPDLRSMSICWVVESVQEQVMDESSRVGETSGEVSQVLVQDGGKGKEPERLPESSKLGVPQRSGDASGTSEVESIQALRVYRVLEKVKGMWQIMDLPMQEFSFI